ncbi:FAD-binding oxidoreductase [Mesorhizobium sp. B2-4-15]|uniref:NAD(P)/FAD-dependent oxidoreductase n=1 Tax=Mesorhizobium sp. B2-4-15 TaxID=2589934 RepID=UPI001150A6DD|nr:FAD-binding oxidoreductase [Mesorhizobium sp. B2-4-15]TPK60440.1 FAD-binding oxidoreductase [Mesorhizobium sp. B2-4-15]
MMATDAIVIGGGIHGCCTALHLALRGLRTILLEKNTVGRHASGVNAGGIRQLMRHKAEVPLSIAAMDAWERLDDLLGPELAKNCEFIGGVGQIGIAETEAEMEWCHTRAAEMRSLGHEFEEVIDAKELRRLIPAIADICRGGIISRRDGHANPFRTTQSFRLRAEQLGVRFMERTRVTGLEQGDRGWTVATESGVFRADILINCAGAWAWQVAEMIGEHLPKTHFASTLMVTSRMPHFIDPVVIGIDRVLSFKQTQAGTVVIGGGVLGDPDLNNETADTVADRMVVSAQTVCEFFPILRRATIVRSWAGLEALMPDVIPVIGPSQVAHNLWHAFGFSGHGFQLGPIVGSIIADLVATGESAIPIAELSPARFSTNDMLATTRIPDRKVSQEAGRE